MGAKLTPLPLRLERWSSLVGAGKASDRLHERGCLCPPIIPGRLSGGGTELGADDEEKRLRALDRDLTMLKSKKK